MPATNNPFDPADTIDPISAIKAVLTDELHIDQRRNPVSVSMVNGDLLIDGVVERIGQKKTALLRAMSLGGVRGVIDRLRVRPSRVMGDKEIKSHLLDALAEEPTLAPLDIRAEVRDGVVDLEGEVGSLSHKRLAGVLAWWIPGSLDVINSLDVKPPEDDNDDEVSDAVRLALEKDRLVDASAIRVSTRNWIVTLDGAAASPPEKEAAEDDAWYVWGVNGVVNNIRVEAARARRTP